MRLQRALLRFAQRAGTQHKVRASIEYRFEQSDGLARVVARIGIHEHHAISFRWQACQRAQAGASVSPLRLAVDGRAGLAGNLGGAVGGTRFRDEYLLVKTLRDPFLGKVYGGGPVERRWDQD